MRFLPCRFCEHDLNVSRSKSRAPALIFQRQHQRRYGALARNQPACHLHHQTLGSQQQLLDLFCRVSKFEKGGKAFWRLYPFE